MSRITIITIVKDNERGLLQTIKSLESQNFSEWNCIILVGQSKDGSLQCAKNLESINPKIRVVPQNGIGIYEAMNQASRMVLTDYVWYMNAGDVFASQNSLKTGLDFATSSGFGLVIGHHRVDGNQREFRNQNGKINVLKFAFGRSGACHQAMVFSTKYLNLENVYNCEYKFSADFDLALRLIIEKGGTRIPDVLCIMEPNGISDRNLRKVHEEKQKIRVSYLRPRFIYALFGRLWICALFLKITLKKVLRENTHAKSLEIEN
jgi:glycosyltransferase involved in cell wall biosynthesis